MTEKLPAEAFEVFASQFRDNYRADYERQWDAAARAARQATQQWARRPERYADNWRIIRAGDAEGGQRGRAYFEAKGTVDGYGSLDSDATPETLTVRADGADGELRQARDAAEGKVTGRIVRVAAKAAALREMANHLAAELDRRHAALNAEWRRMTSEWGQ